MRWFPLARKECRSVLTSKGVWLLALLLVLWGYRPSYIGWDALGPDITVAYIQNAVRVLLPLGVLLLSYQSIVGERTSGSLKFVLGLPLTRTDVLIGKIVGRTIGMSVPVVGSCFALGVIGLVRYGPFSVLLFIAVLLATILYVLVLVSLATAVSAVVERTVTAAGTVFAGVFLLLTLFFQQAIVGLYSHVTGTPLNPFDLPADGPLFFLIRLSPGGAYRVLTNWFFGVGNSADSYSIVLTKLEPHVSINAFVVESAFSTGSIPVYLHESISLLNLLFWLLVPLGIARYRFSRGDLV